VTGLSMLLRVTLALLASICLLRAAEVPKESVTEQFAKRAARLWSLQPVTKPAVPAGVTVSTNPIDAFVSAMYKEKGERRTRRPCSAVSISILSGFRLRLQSRKLS
jgi:hypothetical protein